MPSHVNVARTALDLNHVNHLRLANNGIHNIFLVIGAHRSKSHLPDGYPAVAGGADDFHFAPETETAEIVYHIEDPTGLLQRARLELFRENVAAPLWQFDLTPADYTHGEHRIRWDGRVTANPALAGRTTATASISQAPTVTNYLPANLLPEGYVTAEFSPYKLKITAGNTDIPTTGALTAWTYFHVLVGDITLELGPRALLSDPKDLHTYDALGALPASGAAKEVKLVSNVFGLNSGEWYTDVAFTRYQTLWGDGPRIPILAAVKIKASDDRSVNAHKALGRVKFLWDWEDVPEEIAHSHAHAHNYIRDSVNYYKASVKPGTTVNIKPNHADNCHADHGGKRGNTASLVFPAATPGPNAPTAVSAAAFPFHVEPCATRQWAVYSHAWGSGVFAGKTGVLFRPSRTAGDAYKVTVYLAYARLPAGTPRIDTVTVPPLQAPVHKSTGKFVMYREVNVVRNLKKTAGITSLNVPAVATIFEAAYMKFTAPAAVQTMTQATYDAQFNAAIALQPANVIAAIDPAISQYTGGAVGAAGVGYGVTFRAFNAYRAGLITARQATLVAGGMAPPAALTAATTQITNQLTAAGIGNQVAYETNCWNWAVAIMTQACNAYLSAAEGVTLLHFTQMENFGRSGVDGMAFSVPGANGAHVAFLALRDASVWHIAKYVIAHEIGHHLFMPHAPQGVPAGGGAAPNRHDASDGTCIMSYMDRDDHFCGLCVLRLRGWSNALLNSNSASNVKP